VTGSEAVSRPIAGNREKDISTGTPTRHRLWISAFFGLGLLYRASANFWAYRRLWIAAFFGLGLLVLIISLIAVSLIALRKRAPVALLSTTNSPAGLPVAAATSAVLGPTQTATRMPTLTAINTPVTPAAPAATQTATRSPTAAATPGQFLGSHVEFEGISFTLAPDLGPIAAAEAFEAFDAPARKLRFGPAGPCRDNGYLTVYPVDALNRWQGMGPKPSLLQKMLKEGADDFPSWGAAILVRAQTESLVFENGRGLRALVMTGQDAYLANNAALVYDFHGLTGDGRYYVTFCYPISAPMLLDGSDPARNRNPDAMPAPPLPDRQNDEWFNLVLNYNAEVAQQLEALTAAAFSPDIALLDALVASLRVDPEP
jgi:cell division septation protein DedD